MSKRAKLAVAIGGTLLAVCVLTALLGHREPTYNGLTMSQWLIAPDYAQRKEALLILGTNNLPLLAKRVGYDPQTDLLYRIFERLPSKLQYSDRVRGLAYRRRHLADEAATVLRTLGPKAAPAIPQLAPVVNRGPYPAELAMTTLCFLGDEGLAVIAAQASHTNKDMRLFAVVLLGGHISSKVARLALTNALTDPDSQIRMMATNYTAHY